MLLPSDPNQHPASLAPPPSSPTGWTPSANPVSQHPASPSLGSSSLTGSTPALAARAAQHPLEPNALSEYLHGYMSACVVCVCNYNSCLVTMVACEYSEARKMSGSNIHAQQSMPREMLMPCAHRSGTMPISTNGRGADGPTDSLAPTGWYSSMSLRLSDTCCKCHLDRMRQNQ